MLSWLAAGQAKRHIRRSVTLITVRFRQNRGPLPPAASEECHARIFMPLQPNILAGTILRKLVRSCADRLSVEQFLTILFCQVSRIFRRHYGGIVWQDAT